MANHNQRHSSLTIAPDTLKQIDSIRHLTFYMKSQMAELRRSLIATAIQHPHNPIDSWGEVDKLISGKLGPVDTLDEVERFMDQLTTNSPGSSFRR